MKRCVFCKADSSNSTTVEHIIPESLGNTEHILPPGVVCDRCNNYFAREVEKPLLETDEFTQVRSHMMIANKRGIMPRVKGIHLNSATIIEISRGKEGLSVFAASEKDNNRFVHSVLNSKKGAFIVPVPSEPSNHLIARFVGKVAMEALAQRLLEIPGGIDEIIDKKELDELRHFVRYGHKNKYWPVHQRRLYSEDFIFYEEGYGAHELLHEYIFLYTEDKELYFVVAIFGLEYTINMGGPEIDGYLSWLQKNSHASPLYKR